MLIGDRPQRHPQAVLCPLQSPQPLKPHASRLTSTNILHLAPIPLPRPQISTQRPPKHLKQDLEADPSERRVIAPFAQLVADESMLCPRQLVERESHVGVHKRLADGVATGGRDMVVAFAEDL